MSSSKMTIRSSYLHAPQSLTTVAMMMMLVKVLYATPKISLAISQLIPVCLSVSSHFLRSNLKQ
ncbi:hypothetical protein B0T12DRAFT_401452 [Alternaria alternata]|nr:hypothetical protein B0T12DRAFT_401452 [Alternaria alternata]